MFDNVKRLLWRELKIKNYELKIEEYEILINADTTESLSPEILIKCGIASNQAT
jgi:hypothetical protein